MNDLNRQTKDYVGYEYKQITVEQKKVAIYLDSYENFGWKLDETMSDIKDNGKCVLRLKRDRKIVNKTELTRLQRHFEDCMAQIMQMENQKTQNATIASLVTGIVGMAFITGSVFAVTHEPPLYLLCVILAVPGFLGWICPYSIYKKIKHKTSLQINPMIEEKEEEIYRICEKGHGLLVK